MSSTKAEEDAALDRLLDALDDDPLLNEALGRNEQKKREEEGEAAKKAAAAKKTPPPEENDEESIRRQKAAAGFSSYAIVEESLPTSASLGNSNNNFLSSEPSLKGLPTGGKLKPLGKSKKQKLGALPSLDTNTLGGGARTTSGGLKPLAEKPSLGTLEASSKTAPSNSSSSSAGNKMPSPAPGVAAGVGANPGGPQVGAPQGIIREPPANVIPFDDVQLMPFTFCRELASKGGIAPKRRWGHTVHVYGDSLYCYGGNTKSSGGGSDADSATVTSGATAGDIGAPTSDFFESNLNNLLWEPVFCSKGTVPRPRAQHAAAVSDALGKLIVHGGNGPMGVLLGDTHVYDFTSQEWYCPVALNKQLGGKHFLPERADHSMTLVGDNLYVFGGRVPKKTGTQGATSLCSELWVLDLTRWRWRQLKQKKTDKKTMTGSNSKEAATTAEGEVEEPELSVNMSEAAGGAAKQQATTHPMKRAGHASCAVGSWLILHGGEGAHGNYLSDTWAFNTATEGPWILLDDGTVAEFPRYRHQLVSAGSTLLALGGATKYQSDGGSGFSSSMNLTLVYKEEEQKVQQPRGDSVQLAAFIEGTWELAAASCWMPQKINGHSSPPALRGFGAARHNGFCCIFGGAVAGNPVANNIKRILLTDGIPQAKTTARAGVLHSMQNLLDSGFQADLKMELRGKIYTAHKCVLSLRCPKFLEAILQCHNANSAKPKETPVYGLEGNKRVQGLTKGNLSAEQLALFLGYVYTGRLSYATTTTASSSQPQAGAAGATKKGHQQQQQQESKEEEELETLILLLSDMAADYAVDHLAEVLTLLAEEEPESMAKETARKELEAAAAAAVSATKKVKVNKEKEEALATAALLTGGSVSSQAVVATPVGPVDHTATHRREQATDLGTHFLLDDLKTLSESTNGVTVTLQVSDPHNSAEQVSVVCHHTVLMNRCPFFNKLLKPLFASAPSASAPAPVPGGLDVVTTAPVVDVAAAPVQTTNELNGATAKVMTSRRGKRAEVKLSLPVASVRPILRYLYTGEDSVPPESALPVMMAAHKLELTGLQAICESMVARDEVTADSACAIVAMAMRYEAHHLYEHALLVAAYCFTTHDLKKASDTFAALPIAVQDEIERAAKEMVGKVVAAPTPATELKDRGHYASQFEKSSQPGGTTF